MSFNRKMRRKAQKEFSYKQYEEQKRQEMLRRKRQKAMALLHDSWENAINEAVPYWIQVISLFIPPKWYSNIITKLLLKYQSKCDIYKNKIFIKKWPYWRIAFNVTIIGWSIAIAAFLLRDWMLHIRYFVRTFGTTTKLKQLSDSKFRMVVRYFFSVILDKTVEV